MIFSTVLGLHDLAVIVASLAITATGRPAIAPFPVTTPSATEPSGSRLASTPSSDNEPSSSRRATRSRTGCVPCVSSLIGRRSLRRHCEPACQDDPSSSISTLPISS